MADYFDICGTHIPLSAIRDFRVIDVEFIYRPVFHETKKTFLNSLNGKRFEYVSMQPYAAIIGQQGHKSALGEYKAKDFKEALGKDISGAVIYTVADALKLKAFKHQKYQCLNMAGRAFSTYLDDVPAQLIWNDGRITEVLKEDPLYASLWESTTPGVQYIKALIIKANENYCFYGNCVQIDDATHEYERLKFELDYFTSSKEKKSLGFGEKIALPPLPKISIPIKMKKVEEAIIVEADVKENE